jgi:MFS transporter, ACS family, tartrate transporter
MIDPSLRDHVLRKVTWRLIPFLCLLYMLNILDRANVGFARLSMQDDLQLSREAFDFGYGLFYLGYLLFEVPSNLLLRKVGARRWIARIMISWGLVTCLTMAVTGAWSFYLVRILLGVAEAGFFPGIVLYLTFWFPAARRARVMAFFMAAIAISSCIGNTLSGAIMEYMHGAAGLKGWQWLFVLEGIPSVIVGFIVLRCLTDRPEQADWLESEERAWLVEEMHGEDQARRQRHGADFARAIVDPRVWLLIGVYFTVAVGSNASGAYLPELTKNYFSGGSEGASLSKLQIGLLSAIPHVCAFVGMTLIGWSSDRTGLRRLHVAISAWLAAAGWSLCALSTHPWYALAGLCLAQTGMMSMLPTFWTLPTSFLSGAAAAGGIALINSVANIGGLLGATILGQFGLWSMSGTLAGGGALVFLPDLLRLWKKNG